MNKILNIFIEIGRNEEHSEFFEIPINSQQNKEILNKLLSKKDGN